MVNSWPCLTCTILLLFSRNQQTNGVKFGRKNKGREKNLVVIVWEDGHTVNYLFKKLKSTKFRLFFPQQICFPGITKTFPISEWKCIKITFFIVFFPKKLKFLFKSSSYVPQSKVEDAELWKFHDFLQSGSGDFRTPVEIWNSQKISQ